MIDEFHQISITGRYIYCYFCLRNVITNRNLTDIPDFLDVILKEFTNTSQLDIWQDSANAVLPSAILRQEIKADHFKIISIEQVLALRDYYSKSELLTDVIENLIWLGMANLYGRFDSNITFEYIKDVIGLLNGNEIELPAFSIINSCPVNELGGWGNLVNMDDFLV